MAIGRYRDTPSEMDEIERRVAAAQYPEGGLVGGLGLGIVFSLLVLEMLVLVTPIVGAVLGYLVGQRVRASKIRRYQAERDAGDERHG